jgi:hypothetical protein
MVAQLPTAAALGACADVCQLGAVSTGGAVCRLWDSVTQSWIEPVDDGVDQLHNRARVYLPWLRERMMPAGGVMATVFTDTRFETVSSYGGERDPAIWTGAYLAAEALRYLSTGAADARSQLAETLRVLHRWWNLPGDPGYLARFAASADSDPAVLSTLPAGDEEVHLGTLYEGQSWNWRGNVSRDQYQGVLLGYSLAYDALSDPALREMIRADLVEFAEQLMQRQERDVVIQINGQRFELTLELENAVYLEQEMRDGKPTLEIDIETGDVRGYGVLVFWPRPTDYIRQIPGFGWLPAIELPTQAIQLAATFRAALQVSADVPEYSARHQAIADYYERHVADWLELAKDWRMRQDCGDAYHGINIAFMPAYTWARLETNASRRAQIRRDVLQARLWPAVEDDKNVFFAFLYASQAPTGTEVSPIIASHAAQLAGFRAAPHQAVAVDLTGVYPEDPDCPGQSAIAIDVSQRVPASFIWQDKPFDWYDPGFERRLFGGVDYLLAYWLGRYSGFIDDDAPGTCLAFEPPPQTQSLSYNMLSQPCRILDTRRYGDQSLPIAGGRARAVFDADIEGQGGNADCASGLGDASALVLTLSAVSPNFPETFNALGYATLLNGAEMADGWSPAGVVAGTYQEYTNDTPPFNAAASVVWDPDTRLISTTAVVSRRRENPGIVLFSAGPAHYTLDAVGYFSASP